MKARDAIAERLHALSDQMQSVALDLDSIASKHANELRGAALVANRWAREITTPEEPPLCLRD